MIIAEDVMDWLLKQGLKNKSNIFVFKLRSFSIWLQRYHFQIKKFPNYLSILQSSNSYKEDKNTYIPKTPKTYESTVNIL